MRRLSRKTQISGAGSGGPVEGVWWSGQRRRAASADDDGEVRPHLEAPREGGRVRTAGGGCPTRLSAPPVEVPLLAGRLWRRSRGLGPPGPLEAPSRALEQDMVHDS